MVYEKLHGPNLFTLSKSLAMNGFLKLSVLAFCTFMQLGQLSASENRINAVIPKKLRSHPGTAIPFFPGFIRTRAYAG